jgi:hypothetical protein
MKGLLAGCWLAGFKFAAANECAYWLEASDHRRREQAREPQALPKCTCRLLTLAPCQLDNALLLPPRQDLLLHCQVYYLHSKEPTLP